jgi:16S rRNA processing protein RimM
MSEPYLPVAKIVAAHGIKGQVKVRSFTASALDFLNYGPLYTSDHQPVGCRVVRFAPHGVIIAAIEGVTTRTQAEEFCGHELFVARAAMPTLEVGEYYHNDLVGMHVRDAQGQDVGVVRFVGNFGGGDFLEIRLTTGKVATIPFTDDAVPEVDVARSAITINLDFLLC